MPSYESRRYVMANKWDSSHLRRVDRLLPVEAGARVLEVGCGAGHLTKRLADRGIDITGVDANPMAAEVAESERVLPMRAEALEFDDRSFDAVISVHALEHLPELDRAIEEMARVLRPGGRQLHIYPAEPIMGLYAVPASVILHGTPFKAREVHCQKLWPAKLRRMMAPVGLTEIHHEFSLLKSPQFCSVFEKAG